MKASKTITLQSEIWTEIEKIVNDLNTKSDSPQKINFSAIFEEIVLEGIKIIKEKKVIE